ncbi:uncharacterized protein N7498_000509 [Penicillium cinerascens]|uniref:Uncharacterized protein n=1 Tax=Penicillium cinerascens TaxID=70096 RepID=A0A9W9NEI2_9EURO|nr:uncharacterized protein N7498_000509 [Penicillium cinerascens]KAJ5218410.1 hypothetical protein N7498_000509 [Penicillium cinerascens]
MDSELLANTDFINDFVFQDINNATSDLPLATEEAWSLWNLPPSPETTTVSPLNNSLHAPMDSPTPGNRSYYQNGNAVITTDNRGSESGSTGPITPPFEMLPPDKDALIEGRVAYVLEAAKAAGYETLDELIVDYYTTCFDEGTPLYGQQRLSRSRSLPQFLAACCDAAGGWSDWERKGFREEILKGVEDILVRELRTFKSSPSFLEWLNMPQDRSASKNESRKNKESEIKRIFQNELPDLWALITALIAKNKALQPKDYSGAVFSVITSLCCAVGEHNCLDEFVHLSAPGAYITPSLIHSE